MRPSPAGTFAFGWLVVAASKRCFPVRGQFVACKAARCDTTKLIADQKTVALASHLVGGIEIMTVFDGKMEVSPAWKSIGPGRSLDKRWSKLSASVRVNATVTSTPSFFY